MLLLGFADDVLDLRWRYKLLLPTVASMPLLVVYYVNFNSTTFIVPIPFRHWLGVSVNIGNIFFIFYYMEYIGKYRSVVIPARSVSPIWWRLRESAGWEQRSTDLWGRPLSRKWMSFDGNDNDVGDYLLFVLMYYIHAFQSLNK